jgi:hypothetical protein
MESGLCFVIDVGIEAERLDRRVEPFTASQLASRARLSRLPKHMKRSIDLHRVSMGMVPFWNLDAAGSAEQAFELQRRRKLNRESQRRCRQRKRKAKDGTPNG